MSPIIRWFSCLQWSDDSDFVIWLINMTYIYIYIRYSKWISILKIFLHLAFISLPFSYIYIHRTGESFKINYKLNCDDNWLIYLLTCKCCGKQNVRETTEEFWLRWNNYKSNYRKNARNEAYMQEHLFDHFKSEDHCRFLGSVSITLIDKTDGKDPKRRQNYWMRRLKT